MAACGLETYFTNFLASSLHDMSFRNNLGVVAHCISKATQYRCAMKYKSSTFLSALKSHKSAMARFLYSSRARSESGEVKSRTKRSTAVCDNGGRVVLRNDTLESSVFGDALILIAFARVRL